MATRYRTEAFVFAKEDYREADRMFSVFSRDFGRVEILGRAIRNIAAKLRGGIDCFGFSQIEFVQGVRQKTLTDALSLQPGKHIVMSPERLQLAQRISDVLGQCTKGEQKDQEMWNLLVEVFAILDEPNFPGAKCDLLYQYFFWNFMAVLGYCPRLAHCIVCGQNLNVANLYFSIFEGGTVCHSCSGSVKDAESLSADAVKIMRFVLGRDFNALIKVRVETGLIGTLDSLAGRYAQHIAAVQVSPLATLFLA